MNLFESLSVSAFSGHLFSADDQHACHERVEERDGDDGQREVDDEAENDVERDVYFSPLDRVSVAVRERRLMAHPGRHQLHQGEYNRQQPDAGGDKDRVEKRGNGDRGTMDSGHRVDDDRVAFGAERGQREDGHSERQRNSEPTELTDNFTERPRQKRVDGRHERYGEENQQQVTDCEADEQHVRRGAHVFVDQYSEDERSIADDADDKNESKDERNYEPLGSFVRFFQCLVTERRHRDTGFLAADERFLHQKLKIATSRRLLHGRDQAHTLRRAR